MCRYQMEKAVLMDKDRHRPSLMVSGIYCQNWGDRLNVMIKVKMHHYEGLLKMWLDLLQKYIQE